MNYLGPTMEVVGGFAVGSAAYFLSLSVEGGDDSVFLFLALVFLLGLTALIHGLFSEDGTVTDRGTHSGKTASYRKGTHLV